MIKKILSVLNFSHLHRILCQLQVQRLFSGYSDACPLTLVSSFHHLQFSESPALWSDPKLSVERLDRHFYTTVGNQLCMSHKLVFDPCWVETVMGKELRHTTDPLLFHTSVTLQIWPLSWFIFLYCNFFVLKRMMVMFFFRKGRCFLCALLELRSLFYRWE